MFTPQNQKTLLRQLWQILRFALPLLLAWLLWQQWQKIAATTDWRIWWKANDFYSKLPKLFWVLFLLPLNWCLEALKWRVLDKSQQALPFSLLLKGVMAGVAMGLVSPGRIGELGGRLFFTPRGTRWNAFWATVVGHAAQWVVLFTGGVIGLLIVGANDLLPKLSLNPDRLWRLAVLMCLVGLICYFAQPFWNKLLVFTPKILKKWLPKRNAPAYKFTDLGFVLALAATRYCIYSLQYALMLQFMGTSVPITALLPGIALLFLLQAMAPLDTVSGLLLRSQMALLIWHPMGIAPTAILAGTFGLWVINLLLPSLVGATLIFTTNPTLYESAPIVKNTTPERPLPAQSVL